ncbi:MAG: hypothetical protein M9947_17280 [Thermomicrobiales bacterium]|nr:hypothetical protein [Thermomicrobiales bacterium]
METVRHYVADSGNTTFGGFMHSDAVDYDPFTQSMRGTIRRANCQSIYNLVTGATGNDEEREVRDRLVASQNSYELVRMVFAAGKWEGLDDELPEGYLDPIARTIAQVLDQRDYPIYQLIRRYLPLLDYQNSPTLGNCIERLLTWRPDFVAGEIDLILSKKADILKRVASATLRDRTWMVSAAHVHPDTIAHVVAVDPHRASDLVALLHEVTYTVRICSGLRALFFDPLYTIVTEMVDPSPGITNAARVACRDSCLRLQGEFAAAKFAVEVFGDTAAKSTINRFILAKDAAINNFPATVPAPTAISAIAAAIGGVATDLAQLRQAILALPDTISASLTLPHFTQSNSDDLARGLASNLHAPGTLGLLAFDLKRQMIFALLDGFTVDDDEIAILRILETEKTRDQAELYQLAAAATWESLDTSMDGDEYDDLEDLLQQPTLGPSLDGPGF